MVYNFKSKLAIIGIGGFARETASYLSDIAPNNIKLSNYITFVVSDEYYSSRKINGLSIIKLSRLNVKTTKVVIAISNPFDREMLVNKLPGDTEFASIIHPSAIILRYNKIGKGSIITPGCIITCNIVIGSHSHLNLHTTIGHDCITKDFFTTAPGVNISGNCNIGKRVYMGTESAVREKISICDNAVIGMGGIVVKNITEEGIYVGNPVRKI